MSSHPPEKDNQHSPSSRFRPSVSSKCLSNLRNIVTHNVSSNNQNQHFSHSEKNTPSPPSTMEPTLMVKEEKSRKSLPSMGKFKETPENLVLASPMSIVEKFSAMTVTSTKVDSAHSPRTPTVQGKPMVCSRDILIPMFRSGVTEQPPPTNSRVIVNSSRTPPAMPSNFSPYTRLPHALRNSSVMAPPRIDSYPVQMPLHSRRSFPQVNRPRTPNPRTQPIPSLVPTEIPREYRDCCDSPSTSSNSNSDHSTHRRTSGKPQRRSATTTTTTEQNLIESEERSLRFRQVAQTREIMQNVAKRFRANLHPSIRFPLVDTHCHFDLIFERMNVQHNDIGQYFQDFSEYYPDGLSFELAIQVFWRPRHLTEDNWNWYSKYLDDPRVYASCGIHPHWSAEWKDSCVDDIERCLQHPKVVAIGEIGLDFGPKNQCKMHVQSRAFEAQLKLAAKWNKPIVIHSRDAYPKTFTLMKEYLPSNHKIHLHCFVGNLNDVDLFTSYFTEIKFGFTPLISRSTFLHPVLQQLELSQILCETDSPYFVPDELSSLSRCAHPGMVYSVIETIANLRNLPLIDVARQLRDNARHIYGV